MSEVRQPTIGTACERLALGTANFDGSPMRPRLHSLDAAFEGGVNFIDTADSKRRGRGRQEAIVGRWLGASGRRHQTVLATGGGTTGTAQRRRPLGAAHSAEPRRLQTTWIDVHMLHHVDLTVRWDENGGLARLIAQGKILCRDQNCGPADDDAASHGA
jgi:aryl-alcohol dehydrogenase-like predicted oxidoreductase